MKTIEIEIPGTPVPKGRPRAYLGKSANRVSFYTPGKTVCYERDIQWHSIRAMMNNEMFLKAIRVAMDFRIFRPKTVKRKHPSVRPDLDNYIKAVLDGMNGIVWKDDAQVVELTAVKTYVVADPCIYVRVSEI